MGKIVYLVGVLYRPPNTNEDESTTPAAMLQSIEERLAEISQQVNHIPALLASISEIKECQSTTNASLDFFNSLVEDLRGRISALEQENQEIKKK